MKVARRNLSVIAKKIPRSTGNRALSTTFTAMHDRCCAETYSEIDCSPNVPAVFEWPSRFLLAFDAESLDRIPLQHVSTYTIV